MIPGLVLWLWRHKNKSKLIKLEEKKLLIHVTITEKSQHTYNRIKCDFNAYIEAIRFSVMLLSIMSQPTLIAIDGNF